MVSLEIGVINGIKLTIFHSHTAEERQKAELPDNLDTYWMYGDRKILYPYEIVLLVQQAALDGKLEVGKIVTPENVTGFHQQVVDFQRVSVINALKQQRDERKKMGGLPAEISEFDKQIAHFEAMKMPSLNGHVMDKEKFNEFINSQS